VGATGEKIRENEVGGKKIYKGYRGRTYREERDRVHGKPIRRKGKIRAKKERSLVSSTTNRKQTG